MYIFNIKLPTFFNRSVKFILSTIKLRMVVNADNSGRIHVDFMIGEKLLSIKVANIYWSVRSSSTCGGEMVRGLIRFFLAVSLY